MDPNPAESVRGDLPSAIIQNRHLPRRIAAPGRHRSFNHLVRANAKRLAQTDSADDGRPLDAGRGALRPHLEDDLRRHYGAARPPPRLRCRNRPAHGLHGQDEAEGRDLARSEIPLPSDRFRLVRRPTLEREEAFRDASTSRGKVRLGRPAPRADDAQVAELYRMGLLYDDEPERGDDPAAFDLNSIRHEQPVYSIRPAKRARKFSKSRGFGAETPLHLDLSFSDLGDDTAIAQFLRPSRHDDVETADDEASHHAARQSFPPLRVVYELAGSRPSFDVDTSQPPDLVTDILSDYDCFSDSELDDTDMPSQREVRVSVDNPHSDPWVMLGDDS